MILSVIVVNVVFFLNFLVALSVRHEGESGRAQLCTALVFFHLVVVVVVVVVVAFCCSFSFGVGAGFSVRGCAAVVASVVVVVVVVVAVVAVVVVVAVVAGVD